MSVVAFSRARFTPDDLREFDLVAAPKLRQGHWAALARETTRGRDRIHVLLPGVDRPVFRFERDETGAYHLWFNDRAGWYPIGEGATAAECLAIWRPRGRPALAGA